MTLKNIIVFIGPPGSGKGTLSNLCIKSFGWKQLSTGNLCRKHISEGSSIGKQIDFAIKSGKLVSDSLITQMVKDWLINGISDSESVILDGYPRTVAQAELLNNLLVKNFETCNLKIFKLQVSDDHIINRLSNRYICKNENCQSVYSLLKGSQLMPKQFMKCDNCSGGLIRRDDDHKDSVKERLKIYNTHEKMLLNFYSLNKQNIINLSVDVPLGEAFDNFKQKMGLEY